MAIYGYTCENTDCKNNKVKVTINKPMMESSRIEYCKVCGVELKRDYSSGASIKTGDGVKH